MIFAKIDFINLLPFYIFCKKNISSSQIKQIINYKKSYPSLINKQFQKRKIDGAFISSIKSKQKRCLNLGIIAKNEVDSVFVLKGKFKKDSQSDTSNILAKVLNFEGEVIIGDKALYKFYNEKEEFIDLAKEWRKRYNLPFVFARLCVNKNYNYINNLSKSFLDSNVKIPQYILKKYSKKTGLSQKQILNYLTKISYKIDYKERRSLKLFFKLAQKVR